MDTQSVKINSTTLAYVEQGTGEPIVLVHANISDIRSWSSILPLLAKRHRRRQFDPAAFSL